MYDRSRADRSFAAAQAAYDAQTPPEYAGDGPDFFEQPDLDLVWFRCESEGEDSVTSTLREMLANNDDIEDALRDLAIGESATFGGGAAPVVVVTRVVAP